MKLLPDGLRVAFGHSRYNDRERFGPLHGCQIEVVHLRAGAVEVLVDGVSLTAEAPAMLLMASRHHLEYRYRGGETSDVFWCQGTGPVIAAAVVAALQPHVGALPVSEASSALIRLGAELPLRAGDGMPDFVTSLAEALLQELVGRRTLADAPAGGSHIDRICRYLEDNLERDIGMGDLAEAFALSQQHINRLFKAAFGQTALDYLWHLRVRRGAFMLRHTGLQVSQIAYRNGFKTPNHFSRLIRAEYGLPPRRLRLRDWLGGTPPPRT
jgi:AraC-like DNA-binding protein